MTSLEYHSSRGSSPDELSVLEDSVEPAVDLTKHGTTSHRSIRGHIISPNPSISPGAADRSISPAVENIAGPSWGHSKTLTSSRLSRAGVRSPTGYQEEVDRIRRPEYLYNSLKLNKRPLSYASPTQVDPPPRVGRNKDDMQGVVRNISTRSSNRIKGGISSDQGGGMEGREDTRSSKEGGGHEGEDNKEEEEEVMLVTAVSLMSAEESTL